MWTREDAKRVGDLLRRITFPGLRFQVNEVMEAGVVMEVSMRCFGVETCVLTLEEERQNGRWWRLSKHMTDGEVMQTALMAVLAYQEHETREAFQVDGLPVFQPHWDLEFLLRAAQDRTNTLGRPDPASRERA